MKTTLKNKQNISLICISFIIPFISVLIGFIAGNYAPFGTKNILSAGGYNEYLPYYYELYDRIHAGKGLGYSTNSGLGYDFTALVSYYISDPLNFLILLFPRDSIISALNILYMIKIGLAGSCMSIFLIYKKQEYKNLDTSKINAKKENSKTPKTENNFVIGFKSIPDSTILRFIMTFDWIIIAFSAAYALSLSTIGLGMNTSFTGSICIFPIMILGVERIKREKSPLTLVVSTALSVFCNLHISIISVIFIIFYSITCEYESISAALKNFGFTIISLLCGALISSSIIICSIYGGYFSRYHSLLFPIFTKDNPMNSLRQLISQGILSHISMYGSFDIAICILSVFFTICYILQKGIKISTKFKTILLLGLLISGTFISTIRFFLNGFNLTARNNIHYSYIICFLLLAIAYEEIQYAYTLGVIKTLIAFLATIAIIFSGMFFADSYDNSSMFIKTLEFLFVYFLVLIIFTSKSLTKTLFILLTSLVLLIEVLIPNVTNIANAGNYYLSQKLANIRELQLYEATQRLHASDNNARILIYDSSESYDNPLTSDLSGYDYIVSTSSSNPYGYIEPIDIYTSEESMVKIYVFKIDSSIKHTYYPTNISNFTYNLQNPFESSNELSTYYLSGKEIFSLIETHVEPSMAIDGSSVSFGVSFDNVKDGHVYFNAYYSNHICDAAERNSGLASQNIPISNDKSIKYAFTGAVLNQDNYTELLNTISQYSVINNENPSSFDVTSKDNGYISTSFNLIKSLKFYVNGKSVTPSSVINNNAILPINNGNNHIEVKYSYNEIYLSLLLTLIGIIFCIILIHTKLSDIRRLSDSSTELNDK